MIGHQLRMSQALRGIGRNNRSAIEVTKNIPGLCLVLLSHCLGSCMGIPMGQPNMDGWESGLLGHDDVFVEAGGAVDFFFF